MRLSSVNSLGIDAIQNFVGGVALKYEFSSMLSWFSVL